MPRRSGNDDGGRGRRRRRRRGRQGRRVADTRDGVTRLATSPNPRSKNGTDAEVDEEGAHAYFADEEKKESQG